MRAQIAEILLACSLVPTSVNVMTASGEGTSSPSERAFAFFVALPAGDTRTALSTLRRLPIDPATKARVLNQLPREGELQPSADEAAKLESAAPILIYHERYGIVAVKVIDVPQAFIGLHARSVLLVSREALRLLSAREVQALIAHEMGHEYFWDDYKQARDQNDSQALQEVELKCDGIGALTLADLGLDPFTLIVAARKLTRFNDTRAATANAGDYPDLAERAHFVKTILGMWSRRR